MYQVPMPIWNELARENGDLLPRTFRHLFKIKSSLKAMEILDDWCNRVKAWGPNLPHLAMLQEIYPMTQCQAAIRAYLASDPRRAGLRQVMPELDSPEEGAELMAQEHRLSPEETAGLLMLLKSPRTLQNLKESLSAATPSALPTSEPPMPETSPM